MRSLLGKYGFMLLWHFVLCQRGNLQCGQVSHVKSSVLETPTRLPNACQYTFEAYSAHVCQLLIQFERFELLQPTLQNKVLECEDRLVVNNFTLCGENTQQHLYIPFPTASIGSSSKRQIVLNFQLPNGWPQTRWRLVVTQLECQHTTDIWRLSEVPILSGLLHNLQNATRTIFPPHYNGDLDIVAPPGCTQYFTQSTGTIKSFNFNASRGTLYMSNLDYVICFQTRVGASQIEYNFRSFSMSIENTANPGYDNDCRNPILTPGRRADYLMIPQSTLPNLLGYTPTYYCGRSLHTHQVLGHLPFVIYVSSDNISDPSETGFTIDYMIK